MEHLLAEEGDREHMAQILFETFTLPAWLTYSAPGLAAIHQGLATATVVSIGHDSINIVPVYEGIPSSHTRSLIPLK